MPPPAPRPLEILQPKKGRGRAVLVIHSWWGLTKSFQSFGNALARKGFVIGLADLFDGRTASRPADAKRLRSARRREPMYKTLIRNIDELRAQDGVRGDIGVVGFSMGGHWAAWLSQRPDLPIAATVLYYAARGGSFEKSHASFLAHFADTDAWVSATARRKMEREIAKAARPYAACDYAGTRHWFAESDRQREYDERAAVEAFKRTADHLTQTLAPLRHPG